MLAELGPLAMFGELNASRYSDKELAERGLSSEQQPGCRRTLALKPYGEQSEPDDPFPVFAGESVARSGVVPRNHGKDKVQLCAWLHNRLTVLTGQNLKTAASILLSSLAGNASSAKEVQAFVLDAFSNEVVRLTEDILPIFMSASPDIPKVQPNLSVASQTRSISSSDSDGRPLTQHGPALHSVTHICMLQVNHGLVADEQPKNAYQVSTCGLFLH